MAFGFPAKHKERYSRPDDSQGDLRTQVMAALETLSWTVTAEHEDHLLATTGFGLRSWGEKIRVDFLSPESIEVLSRCSMPTRCLDWGKNKANVKKILDEIRNVHRAFD